MAKDPAFLFYSSDFLSGIADLTMEERGQFITLLCLQHQKGNLSMKSICLSVGNVSVDVLSKFSKDEKGNFYNERLKSESEKRSNFTESRRNNGSQGGRGNKKAKPYAKAKDNHMEDVNENENRDDNLIIDIPGELKNSGIWIDKISSDLKIDRSYVVEKLEYFATKQTLKENYFETKTLKEVKDHFINWLTQQIEKTIKDGKQGNKNSGKTSIDGLVELSERLLNSNNSNYNQTGS